MARKDAKNKTQVMPSQVGGYVPASYQNTHNPRQGGYVPSGKPGQPGTGVDGGNGAANPYSRDVVDYSDYKTGMSTGKKVAIVLVVIALVGALAGLGFYVYKEIQKNSINDNLHSMSNEEMKAVDNELTGMNTVDKPFTMLLLGSDARSDNPGMGARTDTVIVVRVDPVNNVVSLVSIPRDTMINIQGVGTAKFNAAYTYGGPSGTIASVKDLCGIEIDHYAEINFEGLVQLIDAIGGIDVHVDETIDDPVAGNIVIPEGDQHLNGEAALIFSRSRAYADGDYTRQSNQRKVIEAIIHKGLSAPATELYGLISASTAFLTTDSGIDVDFIYSLADQMRHNEKSLQMFSSTIPSTTATIDGISYVIADKAGVAELMATFMAGGDITAPISASSISADLASAGGGSGSVSTQSYSSPSTNVYHEEETYIAPDPIVERNDGGSATVDYGTPDVSGGGSGGYDDSGASGGGDYSGGGDAGSGSGSDSGGSSDAGSATEL